jgi:hypothetical protein
MAHFLVDASLPRATADLIRSLGHQATEVRDIGLATAADEMIAAYAQKNRLCLITRDLDFGHVGEYPPEAYSGIVVVHGPDPAGRSFVLRMIEQFLREAEIVERLAGHLAVVEAGRVRMRPA